MGLLCILLDFFVRHQRESKDFFFFFLVAFDLRILLVWVCCVDVGGEGRKEKKWFFDGMK